MPTLPDTWNIQANLDFSVQQRTFLNCKQAIEYSHYKQELKQKQKRKRKEV